MQISDIPAKIPVPFGTNAGAGNITYPLPTAPQPGGRASLSQGFPPINFTPVAAGGIPPFGEDENGILFWISAWSRWMQAGGGVPRYDPAFQSDVGGYPLGAFLQSATTEGTFYLSTTDNNVTNPDTGGAGWATLASYVLNNAALTGTPTAPTAPVNSSNTRVANTFYADRSATNAQNAAEAYVNLNFLPLTGGTLSGLLRANGGLSVTGGATVGGGLVISNTGITVAGGGIDVTGFSTFESGVLFNATNTTLANTPAPNNNSLRLVNSAYVDNQVAQPAPVFLQSGTGVAIGAGFFDQLIASFTAPHKGTVYSLATFNSGSVGSANIRCQVSINGGTAVGDNTPLTQSIVSNLSVGNGASVGVVFTISTTTSPGVGFVGTYRLLVWFVPTL